MMNAIVSNDYRCQGYQQSPTDAGNQQCLLWESSCTGEERLPGIDFHNFHINKVNWVSDYFSSVVVWIQDLYSKWFMLYN